MFRAKTTAQRNACIANLKMIDSAKSSWMLENKVDRNTEQPAREIPESAITDLLRGGTLPVCPGGGTYHIGNSLEDSTCSLSGEGHRL